MSIRRLFFFLLISVSFLIAIGIPIKSNPDLLGLIVGPNVNMVSGTDIYDGDPFLQRQNEPSIAVSTRNPLHLLAGANDYRSIDYAMSEGELPGIPEGTAAGDAWLGVFKSFDGGQSWKSTLLPGYQYYDTTPPWAQPSPLSGLDAASDPTVRAGTNGLFFYSGIAFEREVNGRSVVFVSRFIDNNNKENSDSIKYIDTKIIEEGTSGQFADKPWIAVDIPRDVSRTTTIAVPRDEDPADLIYQEIPSCNVYVVFSIFLGDIVAGEPHNKIIFARSTDCGNTWHKPIKLSESEHINQGTTLAVDPRNGHIYVAWRRFYSIGEPHAIVITKSENSGKKFSKPKEIALIDPFDQGTSPISFRTNDFPTIAVDNTGIVYVAWSERGVETNGDARIVLKTSSDGGETWSDPFMPIENHLERGHQIMPALTFAAGRLMMIWYDLREDVSDRFDYYIDDPPLQIRHTLDVRAAQALAGTPPQFEQSVQVSRYIYILFYDDENGEWIPMQYQFNRPNYPLFKGGTVPFFGDYIDITPGPMFLPDLSETNSGLPWRFNTEESDPFVFHAAWTDNRDVRPPKASNDWIDYTPPATPTESASNGGCPELLDKGGMRNQNIYTARITKGLLASSPGNTKPLNIDRDFVVLVKNMTYADKTFELTIDTPQSMIAYFLQSGEDIGSTIEVVIPPQSSFLGTVHVESYIGGDTSLTIYVTEVVSSGVPLTSFIILNPDETNPEIINPEDMEPSNPNIINAETHNPNIINPNIINWSATNITNPNIINPNIINPNIINPNIINPNIINPNIINPNIINPNIINTNIVDPELELQDLNDIEWTVGNVGNTTSSYTFQVYSPDADETGSLPTPVQAQLLIYRIYKTPITDGCTLEEMESHELVANILNPNIINPNETNPNIINYSLTLTPGEEARVILRYYDPVNSPTVIDPDTVGAQITSDADSASEGSYPLTVTAEPSGGGTVSKTPDQAYYSHGSTVTVTASATAGYIFSYWEGNVPVGQENDPSLTITMDSPKILTAHFALDIFTITASAGANGSINPSGAVSVDQGSDQSFTITPDPNYHIADVLVDGVSAGTVGSYTFTDVIASHTIHATFAIDTFTITATAGANGTISPNSATVNYGGAQTFTITPDPNYHIADVLVDGVSAGTVGSYTFTNVTSDHTIHATFAINTYIITGKVEVGGSALPGVQMNVEPGAPETTDPSGSYTVTVLHNWAGIITPSLPGYTFVPPFISYPAVTYDWPEQNYTAWPYQKIWAKRYEGPNDDRATAIAYDSSGNVYVTGYSSNGTDNDFLTVKYDSDGNQIWFTTYDGENGNDEASAIDVFEDGQNVYIYVTGTSQGNTTGSDYAIVKYNSSGVQQRVARYDGPAHMGDEATDIAVDATGYVYVTGLSYRGMKWEHSDYCTVKYDSSLNLVWDVRYDARKNGNDVATAIAVDSSGVYVTGRSELDLGRTKKLHYDFYTVKYNIADGKILWQARYNNPLNGDDEATDIAVDSSGAIYVTGRSEQIPKIKNKIYDYLTVKYISSEEHEEWAVRYDGLGNGNDEATAIAANSSGVYVTGKSKGSGTSFDYYTVKYDMNSGNVIWHARYDGENGDDEATDIAANSSGIYVTGKSKGSGTNFDYYTVKYDINSGNVIWHARYDGGNADEAIGIIVDSIINAVYVTGTSVGATTGYDLATVKYIEPAL